MLPDITVDEWKRWTRVLREESREWEAAWRGLMRETGDRTREAYCAETADRWEYCATFRDRGRWMHEFRHRFHPRKQRGWYVRIEASPGWTPAEEDVVH